MSLTVSNKTTSKKTENINSIFEGLKQFLAQNLETVSQSHTYFKVGLEDDLVSYLEKHVDTPLTIISHGFDNHMDTIGKILETITTRFFLDQKNLIDRVYRTNEKGNFLHYYILLKKDNLKNRRSFFNFLNEYEKDNLSRQFPIWIDFISSKRAKHIKISKEIALTDEKPSAQS